MFHTFVFRYHTRVNGYVFTVSPAASHQIWTENGTTEEVLFQVRCRTKAGTGKWSESSYIFLEKDETVSLSTSFPVAAIVLYSLLPLMLLIIGIVYVARRLRSKEKEASNISFFFPGKDKWDLLRSNLTNMQLLSRGPYGNVFLATASGLLRTPGSLQVAIKICHENIPDSDRRAFLLEAEFLKQFSDDSHENIIPILATCLLQEPLIIVMEYLPNGDLKTYLTEHPGLAPHLSFFFL